MEEAHFNAYILTFRTLGIRVLICRNLPCPQKSLATRQQTDGSWFKSLGILSYASTIISILMGVEPEMP